MNDWKYSSLRKDLSLTVCLVSNREKNGNFSKIDKNRTLCIGIWLLAARAKSLLLVWAVKRDDRHKLGIFMSLKKVCQSDWIRYKIVLLLSIVCGIRYGYLYRIVVRGFIVGTTTQTFNFLVHLLDHSNPRIVTPYRFLRGEARGGGGVVVRTHCQFLHCWYTGLTDYYHQCIWCTLYTM